MDEPDYTMVEVAVLVGRNPGIANRFLHIINSPLNRRIQKIDSVSHAVCMLGIGQIHDIVLCASVALAFEEIKTKQMTMKKFWQRSFYCAVMAKQLAMKCRIAESDRLFVNGMLHGIGHLFMDLSIPKESEQAVLNARKQERPLYQVERELLGFDYAELGAWVMGHWGLPRSLRAITCFHPEPARATQFAMETALLHLSNLLVISDMEKSLFGKGSFTVDPTVWPTTRLTEEQCLNFRQTAADQFGEITNSIFY